MYSAAVPPMMSALGALSGVLAKGMAFAEARRIDPAILLTDRMRPDMFPLTRQVQVACDMAKGGCARLAGEDPPSFPDEETTFDALLLRIERTIDYIGGFAPEAIDGSENRHIVLRLGGKEMRFTGLFYLTQFVLPNMYFHTSMAYLILRHNGVELVKKDFLAPLDAAIG